MVARGMRTRASTLLFVLSIIFVVFMDKKAQRQNWQFLLLWYDHLTFAFYFSGRIALLRCGLLLQME